MSVRLAMLPDTPRCYADDVCVSGCACVVMVCTAGLMLMLVALLLGGAAALRPGDLEDPRICPPLRRGRR
jgi:hypothetical protein